MRCHDKRPCSNPAHKKAACACQTLPMASVPAPTPHATEHGHVAGPPVPLVLASAVHDFEGGSVIPAEACEAYMLVVWSRPARLGNLQAVPEAYSSPGNGRAGPTCWKQGMHVAGQQAGWFFMLGATTPGAPGADPHVRMTASSTCDQVRKGRTGMADIEPAHLPARTTAFEKCRTLGLQTRLNTGRARVRMQGRSPAPPPLHSAGPHAREAAHV